MYEINGRFFWDNGTRMRNVLLVAYSRFEFFVQVADTDSLFDVLDIVPEQTLPHSEAIHIDGHGQMKRFKIMDKD